MGVIWGIHRHGSDFAGDWRLRRETGGGAQGAGWRARVLAPRGSLLTGFGSMSGVAGSRSCSGDCGFYACEKMEVG